MDIIKQYDKIGKLYIKNKKQFFSKRPDLASSFIQKNLGIIKNQKLLDIGCGGGDDLKIYQKKGAICSGIDPSEVMVDEARKQTRINKEIRIENIEKTSFKSNYFDILTGRFSLHYLKNMDKAYKEMHRIMKKDAKTVIVVDHPLRSFHRQKKKFYGKQEIVKITLYNKKVNLLFPSHTISDYFTPHFLKNFKLDVVYEEFREFEGEREHSALPNFLGLVFEKK